VALTACLLVPVASQAQDDSGAAGDAAALEDPPLRRVDAAGVEALLEASPAQHTILLIWDTDAELMDPLLPDLLQLADTSGVRLLPVNFHDHWTFDEVREELAECGASLSDVLYDGEYLAFSSFGNIDVYREITGRQGVTLPTVLLYDASQTVQYATYQYSGTIVYEIQEILDATTDRGSSQNEK
jgi:hypothetical protein